MSLIELFIHLETSLGYHQFPVNPLARELPALFESSGSHHDLIVRLAHDIYKANRCQNMRSPITRANTEQALSRIRLGILEGKKTDIDLYHFIEDVCVAIDAYFASGEGDRQAAPPESEHEDGKTNVVSLRKR